MDEEDCTQRAQLGFVRTSATGVPARNELRDRIGVSEAAVPPQLSSGGGYTRECPGHNPLFLSSDTKFTSKRQLQAISTS